MLFVALHKFSFEFLSNFLGAVHFGLSVFYILLIASRSSFYAWEYLKANEKILCPWRLRQKIDVYDKSVDRKRNGMLKCIYKIIPLFVCILLLLALIYICVATFFTGVLDLKSHNIHKNEIQKAIATTIRAIFLRFVPNLLQFDCILV